MAAKLRCRWLMFVHFHNISISHWTTMVSSGMKSLVWKCMFVGTLLRTGNIHTRGYPSGAEDVAEPARFFLITSFVATAQALQSVEHGGFRQSPPNESVIIIIRFKIFFPCPWNGSLSLETVT